MNERNYAAIAENVYNETRGTHELEDDISLCVAVRRIEGIDLTLAEAGKVREEIEQIEARDEALEALEDGRWVPADLIGPPSEEDPSTSGPVLITDGDQIFIGFLVVNARVWQSSATHDELHGITHWRPLPALPAEEEAAPDEPDCRYDAAAAAAFGWTQEDARNCHQRGFGVFESCAEDGNYLQLQTLDDPDDVNGEDWTGMPFPDDDAAAAYVQQQADAGDPLCLRVIAYLMAAKSTDIAKFGLHR